MDSVSSSQDRWLALLGGVIAVLFGVLAFAMPGMVLASLVLFFGAFVIVDGLILLAGGVTVRGRAANLRWILIAGAVVALIIGVLALWNPVGFVIALVVLIGVWTLVSGLVQAFIGIAARGAPYWWVMLVSGVLGIAVGLYIVTQPVAGSVVLVWALGIYAVVYGIGRILQGLSPSSAPVAGSAGL